MKPTLIIQNCEIESAGSIINDLREKNISFEQLHTYRGDSFPDLNNFSAVINLGCPTSICDYEESDILKTLNSYVSKIVEEDKPYLGICFGAQMLAHVLGAEVKPNGIKEIGSYEVRLTGAGKSDPIFENFPDRFPVFHWHGDTFGIPDTCQLLVQGDDCINQAFRHNKQIGLQFHFEAQLKEIPTWCDNYFEELIEVGKTKNQVIDKYTQIQPEVQKLNFQLLDNFYKNFV